MAEIVERLRKLAILDDGVGPINVDGPLILEAIAEIERLRATVEQLEREVDWKPRDPSAG